MPEFAMTAIVAEVLLRLRDGRGMTALVARAEETAPSPWDPVLEMLSGAVLRRPTMDVRWADDEQAVLRRWAALGDRWRRGARVPVVPPPPPPAPTRGSAR